MSAFDQILDFLNFVLITILIIFCILFFIAGDHYAVFLIFMKAMAPLAFFGIIFLIRLKLRSTEIKKRKSEDNTAVVLYLNIIDKLISDIVVFFSPILLVLLIYKARGYLDAIDIIFIIVVFLIMFFWHRYLFNKER